ncbi:MAG: HlyD family type I secretion periplasmic adaptor subunit, partial [Campylobacterales bacterium]
MNEKIKMPSSDDSGVVKFGFLVIFLVFGILGGWMAFAPLASSSVAMGKVSADLNKKTVQHLEGGKVTAIYVKNGDKVEKGQVLLKLRDVQIKAQLDILKAQYQDAIALFARLQAQRDGSDKITFPKELTDENAIKDQTNIFITTKKTIRDEKAITKKKISQLNKQIDGLKSLMISKQQKKASLLEEKLEWENLYKERLVDKQRIRELQREENMIAGDLASTSSQIAKLNEQISETKTQQLLREKEFKKDILQKYVEAKTRISDLKSKIIANEDTLRRTTIKAPISGTVVGMTIHTVGAVIKPGERILDIIPTDAKLIVIAQIQTTDIDKVRKGLLADIMFSAFNLKQINVIQGVVTYVSADSAIDEVTGMPYYE